MRAMRTVPLVAGAVIGGAVVGSLLYFGNLIDIRVEIRRAPGDTASQPATVASDRSKSSPVSDTSVGNQPTGAFLNTPRRIIDQAKKLTAAGRLREAQELFLQVLLVNPDDREAMRGLVDVRRRMAGKDAAVLRRQAKTYRLAIAQGIETEEHYTAVAMDLLATASLLAVGDLEDSTVKTPTQSVRPKPEPTTIKRQPLPPNTQAASKQTPTTKPERSSQRKPRDVVRREVVRRQRATLPPAKPAPLAQPASEPETPVDVNEPFVTITVGPISSGAQASSITTELTVAGYVARIRRGGADYFITLGPYRRSVAERIATRIRSRFGQGVAVSLNPTSN